VPETSIYCRSALLANGWAENIVLEIGQHGLIDRISAGKPGDANTSLNGPVIPGMPNLHSHGFQRMMAGLTGSAADSEDSFWGWRDAMYRFANRISADQLEACMAWVYTEMLLAGFTSCAEFHYLHHQPNGTPYDCVAETSLRVLNAADSSGIAVTLLPVLYRVAGFGQQTTGAGQQRFRNSLDNYLGLLQICQQTVRKQNLHHLGIAPHSLRAVPADDLRNLLETSGLQDMPVHIHIAEQTAEVQACMDYLGGRPVDWLLNNVRVDKNWCLVHATHMKDSERQAAAKSGAVAGLCPTTEADLGDGYFDAQAWLEYSGRFGIGTDSNLRISVSEELRLLESTHRLRLEKRNVLHDGTKSSGRFLYEHAAESGAMALGQNTGMIKQGCRADLVELDESHPLLLARKDDEILDSLVFAGGADMVKSVFVAAKQCVFDGKHVREDELRKGFSSAMKALLS